MRQSIVVWFLVRSNRLKIANLAGIDFFSGAKKETWFDEGAVDDGVVLPWGTQADGIHG